MARIQLEVNIQTRSSAKQSLGNSLEVDIAKFGGLEVSNAKRLRTLEEENARLKRLLVDTMLDNAGLKDLLAKKW